MSLKIIILSFLISSQRSMVINTQGFPPSMNAANAADQSGQIDATSNNLNKDHRFRIISLSDINLRIPKSKSSNINPFYVYNRKLFNILAPNLSGTNMIYSPLSVQTLLAFIYTGAVAETAQELRTALEIPQMPGEVARLFQSTLQQLKRQSSKDMKLSMTNILYYNDYLTLNQDFYRRSIPYFEAIVEPIDLDNPSVAVERINRVISDKTNQRINNLISASDGGLDSDTQAILINAVYLKAKWATEFSALDTQLEPFHVSRDQTTPVNMMYLDNEFRVGELDSLNAKVIDLPFKNSNLSMMIILPNDIDGLNSLELSMNTAAAADLQTLHESLKREQVILRMPKFQFEFEIDMTEPLRKLGASRIFTDAAQLDGFFNKQKVRVDKIQHKAYINVNEGGVEAAAASFGKLLPLSFQYNINYFTIDHPFVFVIRSPQAVYFIGHVIKPLA